MGYWEDKNARNAALLRALGHIEQSEERPPEAEGYPDFDGGVRETAPLPGNPEQDHNNLLRELLASQPSGGGVEGFWPMAAPAKSPPAEEPSPEQSEDWRKGGE